MIRWKTRRRRDSTAISRRTIHESAEGYLVIRNQPLLAGDVERWSGLRDWQTVLYSGRSHERDARRRNPPAPQRRHERRARAAKRPRPRRQPAAHGEKQS
ncbi:MAG: hypothetical protein KF774_17675 [Planctomyces sp.]|nr:hypothetical protein [Planctomyces sp.]